MADMEFRSVRRHKDSDYEVGKTWAEFPKALDAILYLRLRVDTGIPEPTRNDPNPLHFASSESCLTKIYIFIILNRTDREQRSNFWEVSTACRTMLGKLPMSTEYPTIPGYSVFGEVVDLADLPNEDSLASWIDGFKGRAEGGLSVKLIDLPNA
jgi:hypothetical protein